MPPHPGFVVGTSDHWGPGKLAGALVLGSGSTGTILNVPVTTTSNGVNTMAFWVKWDGGSEAMLFYLEVCLSFPLDLLTEIVPHCAGLSQDLSVACALVRC